MNVDFELNTRNQIDQLAKDVDQRSTKTHFDWQLWFNHQISMEKSLIQIIPHRKIENKMIFDLDSNLVSHDLLFQKG